MAERMMAKIDIGGIIPKKLIKLLCKEIRDERVSVSDYSCDWFEPENGADLMAAVAYDGEHLVLYSPEDGVRWGCFEELENFLKKRKIPFSRYTEGRYEFMPEVRNYRPAAEGRKEFDEVMETNAEFHARVPVSILESCLAQIDKALDVQAKDANNPVTVYFNALSQLREQLVKEIPCIPPLPPFRIEDEPTK